MSNATIIIHYEYCEEREETLTYSVESVNLVRFECVDQAHAEELADQIDKCLDVVTL